jgi:hypothetical protein
MSEKRITVEIPAELAKRLKLSSPTLAPAVKAALLEGLYLLEKRNLTLSDVTNTETDKTKFEVEISGKCSEYLIDLQKRLQAKNPKITVHDVFRRVFHKGLVEEGFNVAKNEDTEQEKQRVTVSLESTIADKIYTLAPMGANAVPQLSQVVVTLAEYGQRSAKAETFGLEELVFEPASNSQFGLSHPSVVAHDVSPPSESSVALAAQPLRDIPLVDEHPSRRVAFDPATFNDAPQS